MDGKTHNLHESYVNKFKTEKRSKNDQRFLKELVIRNNSSAASGDTVVEENVTENNVINPLNAEGRKTHEKHNRGGWVGVIQATGPSQPVFPPEPAA